MPLKLVQQYLKNKKFYIQQQVFIQAFQQERQQQTPARLSETQQPVQEPTEQSTKQPVEQPVEQIGTQPVYQPNIQQFYKEVFGYETQEDKQKRNERYVLYGKIKTAQQVPSQFQNLKVAEDAPMKPDLVSQYLEPKYASNKMRKQQEAEEITQEFQIKENDNTSPEVVVALLSHQINRLNKQFLENLKDTKAKLCLQDLIQKRTIKLRQYRKDDFNGYAKIIARLGLRDVFQQKHFPMMYPEGTNIKPAILDPRNPFNKEIIPTSFEPVKNSQFLQGIAPMRYFQYRGLPIDDIKEALEGRKLLKNQEANKEDFYENFGEKIKNIVNKQHIQEEQKTDEQRAQEVEEFLKKSEENIKDLQVRPLSQKLKAVPSFLQQRLEKYHHQLVHDREKQGAIDKLERMEKHWLQFLQHRVWTAMRRDHRNEEEFIQFQNKFKSSIPSNIWHRYKRKCERLNWETYQAMQEKEIPALNKTEQRMFMPWLIDGRRQKLIKRKVQFTENLMEYLRQKAPLFYESRLYNTSFWQQTALERLPKGVLNLERLKEEDEKIFSGHIDSREYEVVPPAGYKHGLRKNPEPKFYS